ncbi:MAG TPA: UDP-2,3-diacylglucosamine diphosphatase [Bacteroidales bacterium]|nr:UDP-2,3-diacylglucosamine diphosphatase [Bacteroidales bacterium]
MINILEDNVSRSSGKIYFASDFHLGIPDHASSRQREEMLVSWLDMIQSDASDIFLMGDVFDFWFEYKTVVPKGYIRLLGKLAQLTDQGLKVHLFTGNHDIWAFSYLQDEAGIELHRKPEVRDMMGKTFYLAHGDGLGPGDNGYKFLKKVFSCRFNQYLFRWLHPDIGARMGLYFSGKSRLANMIKEDKAENLNRIEDEMLYQYATGILQNGTKPDYFIFGHRHRPENIELPGGSRLIILGDWLTHFTYAEFDGKQIHLKKFKS